MSEAAEYLGVSASTLRNWDRAGKVKAIRHPINAYRLYRKEALANLLQNVNEGADRIAGASSQCRADNAVPPPHRQCRPVVIFLTHLVWKQQEPWERGSGNGQSGNRSAGRGQNLRTQSPGLAGRSNAGRQRRNLRPLGPERRRQEHPGQDHDDRHPAEPGRGDSAGPAVGPQADARPSWILARESSHAALSYRTAGAGVLRRLGPRGPCDAQTPGGRTAGTREYGVPGGCQAPHVFQGDAAANRASPGAR